MITVAVDLPALQTATLNDDASGVSRVDADV
jgi:hypothetical protein